LTSVNPAGGDAAHTDPCNVRSASAEGRLHGHHKAPAATPLSTNDGLPAVRKRGVRLLWDLAMNESQSLDRWLPGETCPGAPALTRRTCVAALLATAWPALGVPREDRPYEAAAFEAALATGGGVVLAFMVDWCSTCSLQKAVVAEILESARFASLSFFVADFDKERELKRRLRVVRQSTFVVFKGGREVARAIGLTERAALEALFDRAL
jgi:thiol-disulfide isomerase/thioredoxin